MNNYYVQTVCVDEGDDWWTIAAYEDVESAVAVAKHLLVRDSLTDQALRKAIVCDREEMEENSNLPYIETVELPQVDPQLRERLDRIAATERAAVRQEDIDYFLFEP
jgi:hypothetical protein